MILTTFRLADNFGNHLIEIANYASYSYVLNCAPGNIGVLELELPRSFNTSLLMRDGRIGPWRSINGRAPYHDNGAIYLIETLRYRSTSTFVRASHATGLLDRRIIAYAAGSSYSQKSATAADNQIKAFWSENAGASIVSADRDGVETQSDISAFVATQANLGLGASVAKAAARRRLLAVAQELAAASTTAGTYLTFEIIAPTESTLELRTYATQRGVDRRFSAGNGVLFSAQRGNLENAILTLDATNEVTFVESLGVSDVFGLSLYRYSGWALDTARTGESPFGRIETIYDAGDAPNDASLTNAAASEVRNLRPVITAIGDLTDTDQCIRGIDYNFGDLITVELQGTQYDMRLDQLDVTLTGGTERAQARFQFNG